MKKVFAYFALALMFGLCLAGCNTPMIEIATSNHHIESGTDGHTNLWSAYYKDGGKTVRKGDETKVEYLNYYLSPFAFVIEAIGDIPADAPTGIQMLTMAPKDAVFIQVIAHENGTQKKIEKEIDIEQTIPANTYESKMSENRIVFVVDFMGTDKNNDGTIDEAESRMLKDNFKSTVAFYNAKGKLLSEESFDVKIVQKNQTAKS